MSKFLSVLALCVVIASSCSNLLIPSGSTDDGSTILSYSADSSSLFGDVATYPAAEHKAGDLREIYSWDYGTHLGAIPEVHETFNVVGNTNEHQLTITETTFGGLKSLSGSKGRAVCDKKYGCLDYGSLEWVTLQRAKTAREAITTIDALMQTYGYASEGESFSIADPKEVWMMEVIGKGNIAKGAVWVAIRVPDGYVGAHANQARIRTFPRDQPDHVLFSPDVTDFARSIGAYDGNDADFSFSDTYDPVTFGGARFCEARVYSFFASVAAPEEQMHQYLNYAMGENLTNRMPLFVKVGRRLSVNDTMWHMRNHYEGLPMDPRNDVGGGTFARPYRLGEQLAWSSEGKKYFNERPIGIHYAGWNLVANQRPKERYSVMWFGVDDSTFSLHAPFYGATSRVPSSWSGGTCTGRQACREREGLPGTITNFSIDAMHWVGQLVSNFAYSRYDDVAPIVKSRLSTLEAELFDQVKHMDGMLSGMVDDKVASSLATSFSFKTAERLHKTWVDFHGEVFAKFVDGYTTEVDPTDEFCGCKKKLPHWPGFWKYLIASNTGDRYAWRNEDSRTEATLYNEGANGIAPKRDVYDKKKPKADRDVINKLSLAALGGHVQGKGIDFSLDDITMYSGQTYIPKASSRGSVEAEVDDQTRWSLHGSMMAILVLTNCVSISIGFYLRSALQPRCRTNTAVVAPLLS